MKRLAAALFVATFALLLPHAAVRGQSTTASPTPTPTTSPIPTATPTVSATDLVTRAEQVFLDRKTAHIVAHSDILIPGQRHESDAIHGDGSFVDNRSHTYQTAHITVLSKHPHVSKTVRTEMITTATLDAHRKRGAAWKCMSVPAGSQGSAPGGTGVSGGSGTTYALASPATVTINGIQTYDVQASSSDAAAVFGSGSSVHEDLYISQADSSFVRIVLLISLPHQVTVSGKSGTVIDTLSLSEDFSKYGEPLHIALPAACRGKATEAIGAHPVLNLGLLFLHHTAGEEARGLRGVVALLPTT